MNEIGLDSLAILLLLVLPGLVSMQVYRLIMPAYRIEWKGAVVEGLFYGVVNLALLSPVVYWLMTAPVHESPALFWLAVAMLFVGGPVAWPLIFTYLIKRPVLRKHVQLPYPSAWDYYFSKRAPCFVLLHLKSGHMIGGYFGPQSYATSFPDHGDLYLEAVYRVGEDGTFDGPVDSTDGLLIARSEYSYVELFELPDAPVGGTQTEHPS